MDVDFIFPFILNDHNHYFSVLAQQPKLHCVNLSLRDLFSFNLLKMFNYPNQKEV